MNLSHAGAALPCSAGPQAISNLFDFFPFSRALRLGIDIPRKPNGDPVYVDWKRTIKDCNRRNCNGISLSGGFLKLQFVISK